MIFQEAFAEFIDALKGEGGTEYDRELKKLLDLDESTENPR